MIFTCYESMKEAVAKRLASLIKKANRYNVDFSYTVSEEHPATVRVHAYDEVNHVQYVKASYTVAAVDFDIKCDGLICQNGWTVVAKLEHGDKGNIVTPFTEKVEESWYNLPAYCDHCQTNRFRSVTFLVEKNGEIKQVGHSCLKEYTGIAPELAVMFAEVRDIFPESFDYNDGEFNGCYTPMYDVEQILAYAVDAINSKGYCKSDSNNSSKIQVIEKLDKNEEATIGAKDKAHKIVEWLKAGTFDAISIERNCKVLAESGYAKKSHFGRLVYMPVAYDKYIERKAAEANKEAAKAVEMKSNYVGNAGDKVVINVTDGKLVTSWENQFGCTYLYKMIDENGNVYVWFASSSQDIKVGSTVKGTIKNHSERDGVKQTVVTRCRVS